MNEISSAKNGPYKQSIINTMVTTRHPSSGDDYAQNVILRRDGSLINAADKTDFWPKPSLKCLIQLS
jgi:hypothetical protein